jgi:hypothetical protein
MLKAIKAYFQLVLAAARCDDDEINRELQSW